MPSWDQNDQNVLNPMDNPAADNLPAGARAPADSQTIVRRIEITVEREITTVILRRKDEASELTLPAEPQPEKDSNDSL